MEQEQRQHKESIHIPVLLQEVIEYMDLKEGDIVFDGTYGGGGYSRVISTRIGDTGRIIACDQDEEVLGRKQEHTEHSPADITLFHANFSQLEDIAQKADIKTFDSLVLDLGISSDQLADRDRGISFQYAEAPLDMRMNASPDNHLTAWGIVNSWEENELADLFFHYGGERSSRRIAQAIVTERKERDIETVGDLVSLIEKVMPRRGKIHPATKTFQALRIAVNKELESLEKFLETVPRFVHPGSRVVIVSFHSLEERIVKHTFRSWKQSKLGVVDPKKSLAPSRDEVRANPRSRSARLRSFTFN